MKRYIVIIIVLLTGLGVGNNIISLARLSIGYSAGDMIYAGVYLNYVLFIIPVLFITRVCISFLKRIYIYGSIISGIITGLIMFWYLSCNYYSFLMVMYFGCMGILCFAIAMYLMIKIRPKANEKMGLLAGFLRGLNYRKKFKMTLILLGVCSICVIYIICPKKWVCLYVNSDQTIDHTYEISNNVLVAGDEFIVMRSVMFGWMDYKKGWIFYANESGNTRISILGERFYDKELSEENWDLHVDDNLFVHYDADFEYNTTVYEFFFFIIVNSMGLCVVFLLSGLNDINKIKNREQIENGAQ